MSHVHAEMVKPDAVSSEVLISHQPHLSEFLISAIIRHSRRSTPSGTLALFINIGHMGSYFSIHLFHKQHINLRVVSLCMKLIALT